MVEQGNASLADVSLAILNGAKGSDQTLSVLRQQAADDFTAQVEASGTQYSGYASIEAARVLVRAVTANATDADLVLLVKSAVSFADTATKTPQVVEAIAVNTTLLGLFDTARGQGDPVALAQALADTAKAAAGDPATLESLLRGGGVDKVLKVMPAAATLKDVVKALADGGLPAAVEVVYPTAPTAPSTPGTPTPAKMNLTFDSVTQGPDDHQIDTTTNVKRADVTFKYTGPDLVEGQHFEYSTDGETWSSLGLGASAKTDTVTIEQLDLTGNVRHDLLDSESTIKGFVTVPEKVLTHLQLRAVEGERLIAKSGTDIVYDGTAPTGSVAFHSIGGGKFADSTTTDSTVDVSFDLTGSQGDAIVEWRLAGSDGKWTALKHDAFGIEGRFTLQAIDLSKSSQTIEVRVIDNAGNIGTSMEQTVTRTAPQPQPSGSTLAAIGYSLTGSPSALYIHDMTGIIKMAPGEEVQDGFINKAGFSLVELSTGATDPAHTDSWTFGILSDGMLRFGATLKAGLYEMSWQNQTIATSSGYLAANSVRFAGGTDGLILQEGFALSGIAPDVDSADDMSFSGAYSGPGLQQQLIYTGGGRDVVVASDAMLAVGYRVFDAEAQDLILGFGSSEDAVVFSMDAQARIDDNADGVIQWAQYFIPEIEIEDPSNTPAKLAVSDADEAVAIVVTGIISTNTHGYELEQTLLTLNQALDLSTTAPPGDLLILATNVAGSGAALLYFNNLNGDSSIDAGELTTIAIFSGGVPTENDIQLIGLASPNA